MVINKIKYPSNIGRDPYFKLVSLKEDATYLELFSPIPTSLEQWPYFILFLLIIIIMMMMMIIIIIIIFASSTRGFVSLTLNHSGAKYPKIQTMIG